MQLYHLWSHTIQLHCIRHYEKSSQVLVWVFGGMTSKLMLLNHCNQCWLKFGIVCIYSMLSDCRILFLNNRGGLLAAVLCSSVWSCLSSAMVAFSALFVFLKLLSVLSNSVSAGIWSESCYLCIKCFPVIKTHSG